MWNLKLSGLEVQTDITLPCVLAYVPTYVAFVVVVVVLSCYLQF